jgi:hypothetical protein
MELSVETRCHHTSKQQSDRAGTSLVPEGQAVRDIMEILIPTESAGCSRGEIFTVNSPGQLGVISEADA